MSVQKVNDINYDVLLTHWLNPSDKEEADKASTYGNVLKQANIHSYNTRYPEYKIEEEKYSFREKAFDINGAHRIAAILKLCDYYEYQTTECPHYIISEAKKIIQRIRKHAIEKLMGYDDAPWGLSE